MPMKVLADLHVHSSFSWDGHDTIEKIIEVAKQKGIKVLAITDHDDNRSHEEIRRIQSKYKDILLIPGIEFTAKEGHIVGLGEMDTLPKKTPGEKVVNYIHENSGLAVLVHPFDIFRSGVGKKGFMWGVDAVEAINASSLFCIINRKAAKEGRKCGLPLLGSSDAHRATEVGFARTIISLEKITINDVFTAIKNKQVEPIGKRIGLYRKASRFFLRKTKLEKRKTK